MATTTPAQLIAQHYPTIIEACKFHHRREEFNLWIDQFINYATQGQPAAVCTKFHKMLMELVASQIVQSMCAGTYSSSGLTTTLPEDCHLEDYVPILFKRTTWARAKDLILAAEIRLERLRLNSKYIPIQEHTHFLEPAQGVDNGKPKVLRRLRVPRQEQPAKPRESSKKPYPPMDPSFFTVLASIPTVDCTPKPAPPKIVVRAPTIRIPISQVTAEGSTETNLSPPEFETVRSVPSVTDSE